MVDRRPVVRKKWQQRYRRHIRLQSPVSEGRCLMLACTIRSLARCGWRSRWLLDGSQETIPRYNLRRTTAVWTEMPVFRYADQRVIPAMQVKHMPAEEPDHLVPVLEVIVTDAAHTFVPVIDDLGGDRALHGWRKCHRRRGRRPWRFFFPRA